MLILKRTNSDDKDFKMLVNALDTELKDTYGTQQKFYSRFNVITLLPTVVVAYVDDIAAGCGCFKKYDDISVEIKRMFVSEIFRGKRIAAAILHELEIWAKELSYTHAVLETGNLQHHAIRLYQREDYSLIENYGQYADVASSICMKKKL